jgi:hypothetical protein
VLGAIFDREDAQSRAAEGLPEFARLLRSQVHHRMPAAISADDQRVAIKTA